MTAALLVSVAAAIFVLALLILSARPPWWLALPALTLSVLGLLAMVAEEPHAPVEDLGRAA